VTQSIAHVALVVRDYDEAIAFFTQVLDFTLVEDTYQAEQNKRWVLVAPRGSTARAFSSRARRSYARAASSLRGRR
jgi:catechol 2,3-dioxygenase-like lactoylglutathione lyase family enzyme